MSVEIRACNEPIRGTQVMKFELSLLALLLFSQFGAEGERLYKLDSLISGSNILILKEKGEVFRFIKEDGILLLSPRHPQAEGFLSVSKAMKPTIGVEILKLVEKDNYSCLDSSCMPEIYNLLRAISTLKGIEYYSATRKRMRIFYEDAYVIESENKRKRLQDPVVESIPGKSRLLGFFKDSSFGEYVCSIQYEHIGGSVSMKMQNLTQIWYLFFPIIDPNNMLSYILILETESGILFYGLSCIKGEDNLGIAGSRADSLYNRLVALYNWFQSRF